MGEVIFVELYKTKRIMHNGVVYYNEELGISSDTLKEVKRLIDRFDRNTSQHS